MRTRVKICGITRVEDALAAVKCGVDAIGLVFYPPSQRHVSISQAIDIVNKMPPFITVTALFVNAERDYLAEVIAKVKPGLLQFHGDESPEVCESYSLPFIKAVRVKHDTNLVKYAESFSQAKALLLDSFNESAVGGTGHTFDWNLIPKSLSKPVVLAGGLNVDNVANAIRQVRPYAVDVSGGVESSKGVKDAKKIASFMQEVMTQSSEKLL